MRLHGQDERPGDLGHRHPGVHARLLEITVGVGFRQSPLGHEECLGALYDRAGFQRLAERRVFAAESGKLLVRSEGSGGPCRRRSDNHWSGQLLPSKAGLEGRDQVGRRGPDLDFQALDLLAGNLLLDRLQEPLPVLVLVVPWAELGSR